jgi:hypothetical protein
VIASPDGRCQRFALASACGGRGQFFQPIEKIRFDPRNLRLTPDFCGYETEKSQTIGK